MFPKEHFFHRSFSEMQPVMTWEKICYLLSDNKMSLTHKVCLCSLEEDRGVEGGGSSDMQSFDLEPFILAYHIAKDKLIMSEYTLFPVEQCLFHKSLKL